MIDRIVSFALSQRLMVMVAMLALAIWGGLAVIAAAVWWPLVRRRASADRADAHSRAAAPAKGQDSQPAATPGPSLLRRPTTWMLSLAPFALVSSRSARLKRRSPVPRA